VTYHAFYSTDGTAYSLAAIYSGTSTTIDGLAPSTSYYFKVMAFDPSLNPAAAYSNVVTATTNATIDVTPPSAMSALAIAETYYASLKLTWATGTDNAGAVTATMEYCAGAACSDFATLVSGRAETFLIPALAASTTYCFRGKFADSSGNLSTTYSATVCGATGGAGIGLSQPRRANPLGIDRNTGSRSVSGTRGVRP
jgi:chitodextrinase